MREAAVTAIELSAAFGDGSPHEREFWRRIGRAHVGGAHTSAADAIRIAVARGAAVGAHLALPAEGESLRASLLAQIVSLREVTAVAHVRLRNALHEKTLGDPAMARMIADLVVEIDPAMSVVAPPGSPLAACARARGIRVIAEVLAGRRYGPDGLPQEAGQPGSLLDCAEAVMQATLLARHGVLLAANGVLLPMEAETLFMETGDEDAVKRLQAVETAVALAIPEPPAGTSADC